MQEILPKSIEKLAEKTVVTYKKSAETFGGLMDMDEKNNRSDRLFQKFYNLLGITTVCLWVIESVSILFILLAAIILQSYRSILH